MLALKFGLSDVDTSAWHGDDTVEEWRERRTKPQRPNRRAIASLLMLVSWHIWQERNSRVFRNKSAPPFVVVDLISEEAKLWVAAGAKYLGIFVPRE